MKKFLAYFFAATFIVIFQACATNENIQLKARQGCKDHTEGPQLNVTIPGLFSPNPNIPNDTLPIRVDVQHEAPMRDWHIEIHPNYRVLAHHETGRVRRGRRNQHNPVFFTASGHGIPPDVWRWDGRGNSGEMAMSAMDYNFTMVVTDVNGESARFDGVISLDIMVRREGNALRVIVPSIIFPPDSADFRLLSQEDMRANARVLALIARALNRFEDHRILIEGHANPTTPARSNARVIEERGSPTILGLQPISEARARAVMQFLIENHNVSAHRLAVVGRGGTRTVANYNDRNENWKNRRVEFILER